MTTQREALQQCLEALRLYMQTDYEQIAKAITAAEAALAQPAELAPVAEHAEPMFWVRLCSDGTYEGPLHNRRIEDVRKRSGAWSPLFLGATPQAPQPVTAAGGWLDIETAPKDGAKRLLYWRTAPGTVFVGRYVCNERGEGWMCDGDQVIPRNQDDCIKWHPIPAATPPAGGGEPKGQTGGEE